MRRRKEDVKLTNDQNDSRPSSVHTELERCRPLIVQMQEIKGLCHVTRYCDIDSTYIPYLIVYPMLSSLCVSVCVHVDRLTLM